MTDDSGTTEAVKAIRNAVPTSRHAQMLFDMICARLGDEAVVHSVGGGTTHWIFRRSGPDGDIIPWPLVRLSRGARTVIPMFGADEFASSPQKRPGAAPKLRNLGPGEITLHDGPHAITVSYGDDGRRFECARTDPSAWMHVVEPLQRGSAQATELLAAHAAALDVGRHGPGRVRMPVPLPSGVTGLWNLGLQHTREALFFDRIPADTQWTIVDGFAATARTCGATRESAIAAWHELISRNQPRPPDPAPPQPQAPVIEPEFAEGAIIGFTAHFEGPRADVPMPKPTPANTPLTVLSLTPCTHGDHPWGRWVRLLTAFGDTTYALRREDPRGFTLIGEDLVQSVDFALLEAALDEADVRGSELPAGMGGREYDCHTTFYRMIDEESGLPDTPSVCSQSWGYGFDAKVADGTRLRTQVVRQRWL